MLLGPVDDGVIRPETEPIVRGQGSHVVTQEKEDAQKGDEKSNRLHVVPVHGELDLGPGEKASYRTHPPAMPTQGQEPQQTLCSPAPPPMLMPTILFPFSHLAKKSAEAKPRFLPSRNFQLSSETGFHKITAQINA